MAENDEVINETPVTESEVTVEPVTGETAEVVVEQTVVETPVAAPIDVTVTAEQTKKSGKKDKQHSKKVEEKKDETAVVDTTTQDPTNETEETPEDKSDETPAAPVSTESAKVVNSHRKFDVRFSYSTDTRGISGKKTWSAVEIINQYVKAPSCFIGVSTEEDLAALKADITAASVKVEDKDGKKVEFSDKAKKQLIGRIEEHSDYLISKN